MPGSCGIRDGKNERLRRSNKRTFRAFSPAAPCTDAGHRRGRGPLLLECVLLLRQGAKPARIHIGPRNAPCAGNGAQSACRGIGGPRNENRGPGAGIAVVRHGSAGRRNGQTGIPQTVSLRGAGRADALGDKADYMKLTDNTLGFGKKLIWNDKLESSS